MPQAIQTVRTVKAVGEIVKEKILKERTPGYLYYVSKEGNLCRMKSTNKKKA